MLQSSEMTSHNGKLAYTIRRSTKISNMKPNNNHHFKESLNTLYDNKETYDSTLHLCQTRQQI